MTTALTFRRISIVLSICILSLTAWGAQVSIPSSTPFERAKFRVCKYFLGTQSSKWAFPHDEGHFLFGRKMTLALDAESGNISGWENEHEFKASSLGYFLGRYVQIAETADAHRQALLGVEISPIPIAKGLVIEVNSENGSLKVLRPDQTQWSVQLRPWEGEAQEGGGTGLIMHDLGRPNVMVQPGHEMIVTDLHAWQFNPFAKYRGDVVTVRYFDVENGRPVIKGTRTGKVIAQDFDSITIQPPGQPGETFLAPIQDFSFLQVRVQK